jgi:hypothetical protein
VERSIRQTHDRPPSSRRDGSLHLHGQDDRDGSDGAPRAGHVSGTGGRRQRHRRCVLGTLSRRVTEGRGTPPKVVYNRPCPLEECNGFVDTSKWVCGTCKKHICKECFAEKEEGHECNKDMVETVKMIMKESRPCPKCSIYIHKTEGCDQMWCTQCHTTFSYQTGEIHVGRTHNPMYYQWLRETRGTVPREPGDDPNQHCMTDPTRMLTKLTRINTDHEEERAIIGKVEGVVRLKAELQRGATWNMPWYHRENYTTNKTGTRTDARLTVDSIDGKIRDADWKHRIQVIDKRSVRDQLFRDCMDTFRSGQQRDGGGVLESLEDARDGRHDLRQETGRVA